jgi:CRP/FNR family transcriptional regulator, cyclic AMP receptor protein
MGMLMARRDTDQAGQAGHTGLREVERFADLTDDELRTVGTAGTHLRLPANWSLMAESTPADKAYVLLTGEVSIRRRGEEVARIGPGSVLGEVGILQRRLRTAAAVSLTELEVLHFTHDDLQRLVDEVPAFGQALQDTARDHLPEVEED